MIKSTFSSISRISKKAIIGTIWSTEDKAQSIIETTADLLKVTIKGKGDLTAIVERIGAEIVLGAVAAANEIGVDLNMTIKNTVFGVIKAGSDLGADVAKTAVAVTKAAIKAGAKAGADVNGATREAVYGAIKAGDAIGMDASTAVRDAMLRSIGRTGDVICPPKQARVDKSDGHLQEIGD